MANENELTRIFNWPSSDHAIANAITQVNHLAAYTQQLFDRLPREKQERERIKYMAQRDGLAIAKNVLQEQKYLPRIVYSEADYS